MAPRRIPVWIYFLSGFLIFFVTSVFLTYHFGRKIFWNEYYKVQSEPGFTRGESEMLLAVVDGRLEEVERLASRGVSVNSVASQCSMLNHAIVQSQPAVAVWLIRHGADIRATCQDGTPFQFAATFGFPEVVAVLLEKGVDVNEKFPESEANALHAAASGNLLRIEVKEDAMAESPLDTPEGVRAAKWFTTSNSAAVVEVLLSKKIKGVNDKNKDGETPLFIAAAANDLESAKLLLKNGADVEAQNNDGETPLMMAYAYAEQDVVDLLIEAGANPNAISKTGKVPRAYAENDEVPETESL